jgi:vesicle coat complex subunit
MTIGRDLSWLFPQVVKCIIYLYIINYARTKPIETLLAVNTFKKDTSDFNEMH